MRILLIHRWFWPDAPPYASMLRSIGRRLVEDGHEVTVLTAQPSYNRATQKTRCPGLEQLDGMVVHRMRLWPESKRNYFLRACNMLRFMITVRRTILKRRKKKPFHVVMASTMPPVLVAATARRAAGRCGADFLYHMMDIYPEIALVSGIKKVGGLTRWLGRIDFRNCKEATRVIVLSEDMRQSLIVRGLSSANIVIRNNFRLEHFPSASSCASTPCATAPQASSTLSRSGVTERRAKDGSFRLVFAGNLGRFQGLEQAVEAVKCVHVELPGLRLDFIGEGQSRRRLEQLAGDLLHRCIFFHGFLPLEETAAKVRDADLCLVSLRPKIIRYAYPSKTMSCLAEGCPLLLVVESDSALARLVVQENAGFVAPQNNPEALAEVIRNAASLPTEQQVLLRKNAHALAQRDFTAQIALSWWSKLLADLHR